MATKVATSSQFTSVVLADAEQELRRTVSGDVVTKAVQKGIIKL